jgi:hypothetical protein
MIAERAMPGDRMLVVGVDQGAVDVEDDDCRLVQGHVPPEYPRLAPGQTGTNIAWLLRNSGPPRGAT